MNFFTKGKSSILNSILKSKKKKKTEHRCHAMRNMHWEKTEPKLRKKNRRKRNIPVPVFKLEVILSEGNLCTHIVSILRFNRPSKAGFQRINITDPQPQIGSGNIGAGVFAAATIRALRKLVMITEQRGLHKAAASKLEVGERVIWVWFSIGWFSFLMLLLPLKR